MESRNVVEQRLAGNDQKALDSRSAPALALIGPQSPGYRLGKRALDLVGGLIGLGVLLLLTPFIAVAIKLDSPGPVFFSQERPGLGKRRFRLLKFRTMHEGAEAQLPRLLAAHPSRDPVLVDLPNDPRVTRVGRLLRQSSLDELPQFVNILRGEMSLVGPRPFRRALQSDHPLAEIRFLVKPGLTGPWQISGRKNTTFDQAVMMELEYVRKPSLLADLRILARTIPVVLRTRHGGAR